MTPMDGVYTDYLSPSTHSPRSLTNLLTDPNVECVPDEDKRMAFENGVHIFSLSFGLS